MPSDLSVPRVGAAAAEPVRVRSTGRSTPEPQGGASRPSGGQDNGKPMPNPTLRLDPALAIVVIEFRDDAGKVRDTIPTQAQLDAYRSWQRTHSSAAPHAGAEAASTPMPVPQGQSGTAKQEPDAVPAPAGGAGGHGAQGDAPHPGLRSGGIKDSETGTA